MIAAPPPGALLLHGFGGTPGELSSIAAALRSAGFEVAVPQLPGFGSDFLQLAQRTRLDWSRAAGAAWRGLAQPQLLLGYSMGASLAIAAAPRLQPAALILVAPFWRHANPAVRLASLAGLLGGRVRILGRQGLQDPGLISRIREVAPELDLNSPQLRSRLTRELAMPLRALWELRSLGLDAYLGAYLVRCPVYILQGSRDLAVSPADTFRLAERFPSLAALRLLDGGHGLISERPELAERVLHYASRSVQRGPVSGSLGDR
jgi:carboxylesterase